MKEHPLLTKTVMAILCITALAITAMLIGIDGAAFFAAVVAISGLGGFQIGKAMNKK